MVTYNRGPEQVIKVTKDAIAVLDELKIQYPPATILAEAAKMQREEVGDGVATFVIFLSSLLKRAGELLALNIHPNTIIHGYYLATNKALEIIDKQATVSSENYDVLDVVDCKRDLLTPQIRPMVLEAYGYAWSEGRFDKNMVRFLKNPGGTTLESKLIRGVILKKEKAHPNMPNNLKNLRIAITSEKPGINRLDLKLRGEGSTPMSLNIKSVEQMAQYKETENRLKEAPLDWLQKFKVNVLLCEQPLDDGVKGKLVSLGVFALEKVDKKDTEAIAQATGAKIVGQLGAYRRKMWDSPTSYTLEKLFCRKR